MSPELVLYYEHKSLASIGASCGASARTIENRLWAERKRLKLPYRGRGVTHFSEEILEFIADKKLIIELASCGMVFKDIASKWDIPETTVRRYLSKWGMITDANIDVESISLSELYTGWADIPQGKEMILTVNKKPMFKLVRIL